MTVQDAQQDCRYFVSYSGIDLPVRLVGPIAAGALTNRHTCIRAYFDRSGLLSGFDKLVYGEVELAHRYEYYGNGALRRAEIIMLDEEPAVLIFDETGSSSRARGVASATLS